MKLPLRALLLVAAHFLLVGAIAQQPSVEETRQMLIPEELLARIRPIEAKEQEMRLAILKQHPNATAAQKRALLEPIRQETRRQVEAILATQRHVDVPVQLDARLRTEELPEYALHKVQQVQQVRAREQQERVALTTTMQQEARNRQGRADEVRSRAATAYAASQSMAQQAYAALSQQPDLLDSERVRQARIIAADQAVRSDRIRIWQEQGLSAIATEEANVATDKIRREYEIAHKGARDAEAILNPTGATPVAH
jgi:hypothetical protein